MRAVELGRQRERARRRQKSQRRRRQSTSAGSPAARGCPWGSPCKYTWRPPVECGFNRRQLKATARRQVSRRSSRRVEAPRLPLPGRCERGRGGARGPRRRWCEGARGAHAPYDRLSSAQRGKRGRGDDLPSAQRTHLLERIREAVHLVLQVGAAGERREEQRRREARGARRVGRAGVAGRRGRRPAGLHMRMRAECAHASQQASRRGREQEAAHETRRRRAASTIDLAGSSPVPCRAIHSGSST